MWIVNNRKIFYSIAIILVIASLAAMVIWGLRPGIDFTGGTLVEVSYPEGRPAQDDISSAIAVIDPSASVRPTGDNGYIIRLKALDQEGRSAVVEALSFDGSRQVREDNFSSIGPLLGAEALRNSLISIIAVILAIVLYITFAFRKVSDPVASWKYGLIAIAALAHDVIIPTGLFAILGRFAGYEVDTLFVTALLVILGFSIHDTIVVFDRVRENLKMSSSRRPFVETVGVSITQTLTRSINTSLTTLIALAILYIFGGSTVQHFTLALIVGIAAGTYSSIFVASPLLVTIEKFQKNK